MNEMLSESEDNSGYNSDKIDSDLEVELYGAVHHSFADSGPEVATDDHYLPFNSTPRQPIQPKVDSTNVNESIETNGSVLDNKPLNNLFRLLDRKNNLIDNRLDEELDSNKSQNKRKIDCIQIDDSSDDSIIFIDYNNTFDNKHTNNVQKSGLKSTKKLPKKKSPKKKTTNADISLGNVNNLNETIVSEMDQFYNEDSYDSEEEERSFNAMNSDRRFWKISYNDIVLSTKKNNRYYRNRFICKNCNERGHQDRECPEPKKSPICYLCGLCGHRSDRCKAMVCSRCLSSRHRTINCDVLVNQLVCDECGVGGHEANECTYNWRKYHLTTTSASGEPIIPNLKPNQRKCCYNCGSIGKHFGFECHLKPTMSRMIPVSQIMSNPRRSHCFNGRVSNKRRNCGEKVFSNEFVKSISGNELSRLSASFNKPLEESDSMGMSGGKTSSTTTTWQSTYNMTPNNQNKHIKWVYPDMNGLNSSYESVSTRSRSNCRQNRGIGEPSEQTVLKDWSPVLDANTTAHTLTMTRAHRQINNSMQEKSQTQTTPKLNERSKRKKNKRKKRKIAENSEQLLRETNITLNSVNNTSNQLSKRKQRSFRRVHNWKTRKSAQK